jgi:septum formation protein
MGYHRRMFSAATPCDDPPSDNSAPGSFRGNPRPILLASQSPRRRRLIEWLGLPCEAAAVDTPESLDTPLAADPPSLAISLAAEKAVAARDELPDACDALVLCFDTLVVLDGRVLGKPLDVDDAWMMLRGLSGREHQVVTGVAALVPGAEEPVTFSAETCVQMRTLSDADIEAWMRQGTFLGCAGAYNIEEQVAEVTLDECYQNVAGLPLCHLYAALVREPALRASLPHEPAVPVAPCDTALCRTCRLGPRLTSETPGG